MFYGKIMCLNLDTGSTDKPHSSRNRRPLGYYTAGKGRVQGKEQEMSETYHILDDKEMDKIITFAECRTLREAVKMLTVAPMLKKKEYVRFMVVIDSILKRMERAGKNENKTDFI